ncbi:MAG: ATP-binding protein [Lachnospiraceae bacterium]|nr:ATP-binding protein [Lachnospiraceae bacterium]
MFYGRTAELDTLEKRYRSHSFECVIVYGRRRVGKTTLIDRFCTNKPAIFFSAIDGTAQDNLDALSGEIYRYTRPDASEAPVFGDIQSAFGEITELAKKEQLVVVIDEYPYLAKAIPSVSSRLQHMIDHAWSSLPLMLILCGSSMSFMTEQVLGYESPLYGRRTAQIKPEPFTYLETRAFTASLSLSDSALVYGITGGTPHYIRKLYQSGNLYRSILDNLFERSAYLYEEPENLLKQELREPAVYSAILGAVAHGASRLNEIATKTGITTGVCANYLNHLITLDIVKKETPITEKEGKKTLYRIQDQFFRFWYRFVRKNSSAIGAGRMNALFDTMVKGFLPDYMGQTFEVMCRDFLLRYDEHPQCMLSDAGRWWGTDTVHRRQVELDIVGTTDKPDVFLLASCKYRNGKTGIEVLEQLKAAGRAFGKGSQYHYCVFSKSGFTAELKKTAEEEGVRLVDLNGLYLNSAQNTIS